MAISHQQLLDCLSFDPKSGRFTWKQGFGGRAYSGKLAGTIRSNGYRQVRIHGVNYLEHRLVWLYLHGALPEYEIDHVDGCKSNNRPENLRECTAAQNRQNIVSRSGSTSQHLGVSWNRNAQKWQVRIKYDGKDRHIGLFTSEEDAASAYLAEKAKHHHFQPIPRGAA